MRVRVRSVALAALVGGLLAGPAPADDGEPFDERARNVFFHRPDSKTSDLIEDLISNFSTGSVADRTRDRHELERIGHWSVEPLVEALIEAEPPIRSASALTLGNIRDPRAIVPLREAVERETSHPYVAGFAALALGRYRDADSVAPLAEALRSPKSIRILRAAAPLTVARIRSPEAATLLMERIREGEGDTYVKASRFLALGFFPELALRADRPEPSETLRKGIRSKRREHRRAAVLGFLVATSHRRDTRDFLLKRLDQADSPSVEIPLLVGLSRYADADTTKRLAHVAARPGDEIVRAAACGLLVTRHDPAAMSDLLSILRKAAPATLKASAVVALAGIDDDDASSAVLDRLNGKSPVVRGAAAVGATLLTSLTARDEALRRIDARLRRNAETSRDVRANLKMARAVLRGELATPQWREVGADRVFGFLFATYEDRLLHLVNRTAEEVLDEGKIKNLQTDTEILPGSGDGGSSGSGGSSADDGTETGDGDETGDDGGQPGEDVGETPPDGNETDNPTPVDDQPTVEPPPGAKAPSVGSPRTSAWQELRDLKVELRREPYFGVDDLPAPPPATGPR